MVLLIVQPDTEWEKGWVNVGFEVPGDLGRFARTPGLTEEMKGFAGMALAAHAMQAINEQASRPDLAEMEIDFSVNPRNLRLDLVQEGLEELEVRRIERKPLPAVTDLMKRDRENWCIDVYARRKKRLMPKYPDQKGPNDGYEAWEDLPQDWAEHMQPVLEEVNA